MCTGQENFPPSFRKKSLETRPLSLETSQSLTRSLGSHSTKTLFRHKTFTALSWNDYFMPETGALYPAQLNMLKRISIQLLQAIFYARKFLDMGEDSKRFWRG